MSKMKTQNQNMKKYRNSIQVTKMIQKRAQVKSKINKFLMMMGLKWCKRTKGEEGTESLIK